MNKTYLIKTNILDVLHTLLLFGAMLGLLALLGFSLLGVAGVMWASLIGGALLLFGPRMSPKFLLRFYRARYLTRYEAPDLYRLLDILTRRANLPTTPALYYLPQPLMNAFAMGDADQPIIGITAGLIRNLNKRELTSVLAHEMSHIRNRDTRVMGLASLINQLTGMLASFGQILLLINLPLMLFGVSTISWLMILLLMTAPTLTTLLQLALSRRREFAADKSAADLTGDPEGLVQALQKLEYHYRGFFGRVFRPSPDTSWLRTHPKTSDRIQRLRALLPHTGPTASSARRVIIPVRPTTAVY